MGFSVLIPFWVRFDVSASTLAYLVGLTFLGARGSERNPPAVAQRGDGARPPGREAQGGLDGPARVQPAHDRDAPRPEPVLDADVRDRAADLRARRPTGTSRQRRDQSWLR